MTTLGEILDEIPIKKTRISVPADHTAIILPNKILDDVKSMCLLIRRNRRPAPMEKIAMRSIAGDLLLALVEAGAL